MNNSMQPGGPRRSVSGERKTIYYIGMVLMVIGFLLFGSVFISMIVMMGQDPFGPGFNPASAFLRAPLGIGLVGGLFPALRAARLPVTEALRGT